jgi:pimeloyl-ACP methyl ester carboxylesterase
MQKVHDYLGEKISYSIQGKGRTIVLIHGFLGSRILWGSIAKRLSLNFKVITIDLPGHGDSSCIGYVHSMEMMADLLKSVLDSHKVRKAVVVGHSLGGYVSLAFAEKYPDKLHGLIMVNSSASSDSEQRISSRNQLIEIVKKNKNRAIDALIPSFFVGDSAKIKRLMRKYKKEAIKCSTRGIIATIEGMKNRTEREIVLKFAPYPYLYIIGNLDPILDKNVLMKQIQLNSNGFGKNIVGSSHMSFLEEEGKVYLTIKKFAKDLRV